MAPPLKATAINNGAEGKAVGQPEQRQIAIAEVPAFPRVGRKMGRSQDQD